MLLDGSSKLGFCNCTTCNQGYREYLATLKKRDGRSIGANSREIVKEVYGKDLSDVELDIAKLFGKVFSKQEAPKSQEISEKTPDSFVIEIPGEII
jgi:hypothetical protein